MIKGIIFDLDGVLVDSKNAHFELLNESLSKIDQKYIIKRSEHNNIYDGLPSKIKLGILVKEKSFPKSKIDQVFIYKQELTSKYFENKLKFDPNITKLFKILSKNFKLGIATNCVSKTLDISIKKLKIKKYLTYKISNEDVDNPKPHSEIYLKSILALGLNPDEVLIVEDSNYGRISAIKSGAHLLPIENQKAEVSFENIISKISILNNTNNKIAWSSEKMNILIPMSGRGSRFSERGYIFPKPLIEVGDKPMIQVVIESLNIDANYIFIILKDHIDQFNIDYFLKRLKRNCKIVVCDKITEGAASTSLLAAKHINNKNPLMIVNSDQYIEWDSKETMYSIVNSNKDGAILTFKSNHPKWSYALTDKFNIVKKVAEKKPISDNATVGVYYWKKGSDYVKYAKSMIKSNIRVNNEFYICPVYNEAIKDKKTIITKQIDKMWGLGTPEDLEFFLKKNSDI